MKQQQNNIEEIIGLKFYLCYKTHERGNQKWATQKTVRITGSYPSKQDNLSDILHKEAYMGKFHIYATI